MPPSVSVRGPYSPFEHTFAVKATLSLHAGSLELLADDIAGLAKDMEKVEGNNVMLWEAQNMTHNM